LELGHSAPIGQEFELVVLDDLEFQLTLQTKLEPPPQPPTPVAPAKAVNHKKSHSAFRNVFSSPKKRKEQERRQQEEAERLALQQQQEAEAKRMQKTTAWDLLHNLVGSDGSFARAYVCLKNHENQAYGRPLTVDIPCFNEWAVDDTAGSSVKSKRGGVVRRPPYRIGKLTLQLLYVPKPKDAKDDDMPKSMNACIRELKEAEQVKSKQFEGFLSQQGGDCPVSHPNKLQTPHRHGPNTAIVLAPPILPARWHEAYSLPRNYAPAACHYQPCQGDEVDRRQNSAPATVLYEERWPAQIRLCGRRRRLHVCRGRLPYPFCKWRNHRFLRGYHGPKRGMDVSPVRNSGKRPGRK
jgi:hypothetical protein